MVDGYRELDAEGKALVLATVRKLAKDVEARMIAAGFIKMTPTPEKFKLIMCYRAANAQGKARIMAAAEAAPERQEADLNLDHAAQDQSKRASPRVQQSTRKTNVPQRTVSTGNLPAAFFANANKHRSEV